MNSQRKIDKRNVVAENYKKIRVFRSKTQDEIVKYLLSVVPQPTGIKQNVSAWENLKGNPGQKYIDYLTGFLKVPRETFYIENLTEDYLKNILVAENHTPVPNMNSANEKSPSVRAEAYRDILENYTDYILMPRFLLESHRLTSLEQIQRDKELVDGLIQKNEELYLKVIALEAKSSTPQKAEQGSSIS